MLDRCELEAEPAARARQQSGYHFLIFRLALTHSAKTEAHGSGQNRDFEQHLPFISMTSLFHFALTDSVPCFDYTPIPCSDVRSTPQPYSYLGESLP